MAETIGSLVDKISIAELKIFHMQKQVERTDTTAELRTKFTARLAILKEQRNDLSKELTELASDVASGKRTLKVYRQFKMYNDPVYRSGTQEAGHKSERKK